MKIHAYTYLGTTAPDAPLPEPTTPTVAGWTLIDTQPCNVSAPSPPPPPPPPPLAALPPFKMQPDVMLFWEGEEVPPPPP